MVGHPISARRGFSVHLAGLNHFKFIKSEDRSQSIAAAFPWAVWMPVSSWGSPKLTDPLTYAQEPVCCFHLPPTSESQHVLRWEQSKVGQVPSVGYLSGDSSYWVQ